MSFAGVMLGALVIDAAFGWPKPLFQRIGHPVTWLGAAISALEARLNDGPPQRRFLNGLITTLLIVLLAAMPALVAQALLPPGFLGLGIGALLAWPLIALRSLRDHVTEVAKPLLSGDLAAAKHAVSMIVGRDPEALDQSGIARAAIESLAENASDGIVAPVFWGVVAGLPGIAAYKAVNTLDSMIGHRTPRYEQFGKAAARLDDAANWIPARLTGLFISLVSGRPKDGLAVMRRDAPKHRSPNAGWPEGAMAAALNVRLSGPRIYEDRIAHEPWLNGTARDPEADDLRQALHIYDRAMLLGGLVLLALALF